MSSNSNGTEELGIRLSAEGMAEFTNGMGLGGKAVDDFGKKADGATPPLTKNTAEVARSGNTARQTAAAWRLLPAQITDVVTSLASGQPAWLIAIQQGGQIKDSFGGIGPMFSEIFRAIGPLRLAMMGLAGAGGLVVLAHERGRQEAQAYSRALILSGNAAGTYAGEMSDMARAISEVVGTQGKAAEALALMAGTGEVARRNLQPFAQLGMQLESVLGRPLEETAQRFAELGRAPLDASLRLNRGINYLTASIYEQIRALQAQGRLAEAAEVAQKAYATAMAERTAQVKQNLGALERAVRGVGNGAKWMWDQLLDVGREETLGQKIEAAEKRLAALQSTKARKPIQLRGPDFEGGIDGQIQAQQAVLDGLRAQRDKENKAAAGDAAAVAANQAALRQAERTQIDAENALSLAQARARSQEQEGLMQRDLAIAQAGASSREDLSRRELSTLEDLRDRDAVSLADYYTRRAALDRQALGSQIQTVDSQISAEIRLAKARGAVVDAELAAERRRLPETPAEVQQQQARLVELQARGSEIAAQKEARLIELRAQRSALGGQQAAADLAAQRSIDAASQAAETRFLEDLSARRQALGQFSEQLRASNAANAVDLIADPFVRATARARLEIDELNRYYSEQTAALQARRAALEVVQPDAVAGLDAEMVQAEQRKADAILMINSRLAEDLKPEWQRMLEGWRDTTRLMRESYDEFQNGWLRTGEQAWTSYLQTGKVNLSSLKDFALGQFAQMTFKRYAAEPMQKAGDALAGMLGFKTAGGGEAAGLAAGTANTAAVTANTSARTAEVVALNLGTTALGNLATTASLAGAALATMSAQSAGGGAAGLVSSLLSAYAGGSGSFSAVDLNGYGMTSGGQILPTRGGAAGGGNIMRGSLLEVNEQGPELLSVNGRTYLMMGGRDGYVTPNGGGSQAPAGGGGGSSVVLSPTIHIDSRSDKAEVMGLVQKAMQYAQAELLDRMERGRA